MQDKTMADTIRDASAQGIIKIDVPDNRITDTGIMLIQDYLGMLGFSTMDRWFEWSWVERSGKLQGTLPKRVSRVLRKNHHIKLTPDQMAEIGNIAKSNSHHKPCHWVDFVNVFDWKRGDYGDPDSCFWTEREGALDVLEYSDVWAVRFYDKDKEERLYGFGRAFLFPDVPNVGLLTLVNSYPKGWGLINVAKVLGHWLSLPYGVVEELGYDSDGMSLFFVNNDRGYVVGREASNLRFKLKLKTPFLNCRGCGNRVDVREPGDYTEEEGYMFCKNCEVVRCHICEAVTQSGGNWLSLYPDGNTVTVCRNCVNNHGQGCWLCNVMWYLKDVKESGEDYVFFMGARRNYMICHVCFNSRRHTQNCFLCSIPTEPKFAGTLKDANGQTVMVCTSCVIDQVKYAGLRKYLVKDKDSEDAEVQDEVAKEGDGAFSPIETLFSERPTFPPQTRQARAYFGASWRDLSEATEGPLDLSSGIESFDLEEGLDED